MQTNQASNTSTAPATSTAEATPQAGATQVSTGSPQAAAQATNTSTQPNSETAPKTESAQAKDPAGSEAGKAKEGEQKSDDSTKNTDPEKGTENATDKPAEIADFVVPEGVSLDPQATTELKSIAKELGLKQEGAQKIADLGVKLSQKWQESLQAAIETQKAQWKESLAKDQEFGGDKLAENLTVVARARDQFATPELVKYLNESGMGDHPEMVRMFYRVGKQISEDTIEKGNTAMPLSRDYASVLYPNG